MLAPVNWLQLCENGAELIATLDAIRSGSQTFPEEIRMGPPVCGIKGPCSRCWIFPRLAGSSYCETCHAILSQAKSLGPDSRTCLLIWGAVNFLPSTVKQNHDSNENKARCVFIQDGTHFLAVVKGCSLGDWMKETVLEQGPDFKGLLTVFPTTGKKPTFTMGDILCRAVYYDSRFPLDRLRIRFFSKPGQLKVPHKREQQGILTFEPVEFIALLEMARMFKSSLGPREREAVSQIISITDRQEQAFYWGRLMGVLSIKARDLLSDWGFRELSLNRMRTLCELTEHVTA